MSRSEPPPDAGLGGLEVAPGVRAPRGALGWRFTRSGGPGGQNVNKVSTKAELRLDPGALQGLSAAARRRLEAGHRLTGEGDLLIVSDRERTQERNRAACLARLRTLLVAAQVEPTPRRPTRPSRGSRERRMTAKRVVAEKKRGRARPEPE
jgi:ribosome-associated protein